MTQNVAAFDVDPKRAAIDQWTADPCGSTGVEGDLGTGAYFQRLLAMRSAYAPWMFEELDYPSCGGLRVLDVGCGQGIDVCHYARAGARVTGIDLTPRSVELAGAHLRSQGLEARLLVTDAERMPFDPDTFDRVSSNGVLHHTPDILASLCEIQRVLRPGGEAVIIVYNRNSLHYWVHQVVTHGLLLGKLFTERSMQGVMARTVEKTSIDARPLVRVYSPRQIRGLLHAAGFVGVSTTIRHFKASDTAPTHLVSRLLPRVEGASVADWIGRQAGWYVVARGNKRP